MPERERNKMFSLLLKPAASVIVNARHDCCQGRVKSVKTVTFCKQSRTLHTSPEWAGSFGKSYCDCYVVVEKYSTLIYFLRVSFIRR